MMGAHGALGDMTSCAGMMVGGFIWMSVGLGVLVLAVLAIAWLALRLRGDAPSLPAQGSNALGELDGRYARGEIDRDTYLTMRGDLGGR